MIKHLREGRLLVVEGTNNADYFHSDIFTSQIIIKLMKNLFVFSFLITIILFSRHDLQAQTKNDIIQCLGTILEFPDMNEIYQNQTPRGQVAVVSKDRHFDNNRRFEMSQVLNRPIDENDFPHISNLMFSTNREAELNNVNTAYMLTYNFQYYPEREFLVFNTDIVLNQDRQQKLLGRFEFQKNETDEWELIEQAIIRETLKLPVLPIDLECRN